MYTVAGATGQVGSAVATALLDAGQPVRVVVRDATKGVPWWDRGAEVAVADLRDAEALSKALTGSDGAFLLLPFDLGAADIAADQRAVANAVVQSVVDAEAPHVVMLSSVGADLDPGPELMTWLGDLETRLRSAGPIVTAVRSAHFQEKARDVLPAAQAGVYPVFASSADRPIPMVATRDVGAVAAEALLAPPTGHRVIDVGGPAYTERRVAEVLGEALGRSLDVAVIPREGWFGAMTDAGLPPGAAELLVALYAADDNEDLQPRGDGHVLGSTPLESTIRSLMDATTVTS